MRYLTFALAKGRLAKTAMEMFEKIGIQCEEMKDEKRILNKRQQNKKESAERKWKVIQEVQQLYKDGYNKSQISRKMNITRVTVNTYLLQKQPLERSTNSILDDYVPMIKELIIQGKKIDEILKLNLKDIKERYRYLQVD